MQRRIGLKHFRAGFPLRFCLLSTIAMVLIALVPQAWLPPALAIWFRLALELLIIYTGLRLLGWLLLQLPERLGLWRGPSKILIDLLLLVIGTVITVIVVQQRGQVNLVGLVTTSAVLTAVIGLAAQETLKDLFAGITLQLDPPFREGDWIDLNNLRGTVTQLTLMNTHLRAMDGSRIVISNRVVAEQTLRRFRPGQPMGNRFSLGLDYALPPSEALALLRQVLDLHPDVLSDPEPRAWVGAFDDSSISYEILVFQQELGDVPSFRLRSELLEQIWYALERVGQSVPFPVREIRHRRDRASHDRRDVSRAGVQRRAELLRSNPLLESLSVEQLQELAPLTRCIRFAAGEVIVREGDRGDALFQVIEGRVTVLKASGGGPALPVATLRSGDVFGEMTLCVDEPRSATVQALEQTVLLEVERRDLLPLIESDPTLLERIAELAAARRARLEQLSQTRNPVSRDTLLSRMRLVFSSMTTQAD